QSFLYDVFQLPQSAADIRGQMHAQRAPLALCQNLEVAARLRCLHDAKRVLLAGHRKVYGIISGDLQEDSRVWPTLICLPGRVQEARTETKAGRRSLRFTDSVSRGLQTLFVGLVHLYVSQEREVISGGKLLQMCAQHT